MKTFYLKTKTLLYIVALVLKYMCKPHVMFVFLHNPHALHRVSMGCVETETLHA